MTFPRHLFTAMVRWLRADTRRKALKSHYKWLHRYANDIILLMDERGSIVEANDCAVESYRCSRSDLLRLNIRDLRDPDSLNEFSREWESAVAREGVRFETRHRRADGTVFPVEVNSRTIRADGHEFRQSIIRDISERKRSEQALSEALRERERYLAQLEAVLDHLTDGVVVSDLEGNLVHWNRAALAMNGYTSPEEGRRAMADFADTFELSTEQDGVLTIERWPLARILRGETVRELEVHVRRRTSDWHRIFRYSGTLARDCDGQPLLAVVSGTDVTNTRQAEDALRASEALLRAMLENVADGIYLKDRQGRMLLANPAVLQAVGKPESEVIGKTDAEFLSDAVLGDSITAADLRIMERGETETLEEIAPTPRGNRVFLSTKSAWRDSSGRVTGLVGVSRDITDRKRAEEQLQVTAEYRRLALEAAGLGAWDFQLDTGQVSWDERCEKIFDICSGGTVDYETLRERKHPEDRAAADDAIRQAIAGKDGGAYHSEYRVIWGDGSLHWVASHGTVYFTDESGAARPKRFIGVAMDITERKQVESDLRNALAEAEEGRRMLDAIMDHIPLGIMIADAPEGNIRRVSRYGLNQIDASVNGAADLAAAYPSRWQICRLDGSRLAAADELPLSRAVRTGEIIAGEEWLVVRSDGTKLPILCTASPIRDNQGRIKGGVAGWQDITQRKSSELRILELNRDLDRRIQQLEALFQQKNVLLREVQHRVKNNLQVISSLLSLESDRCGEGNGQRALLESRDRVHSMALIHEQLCHSDDLAQIDFREYVDSLGRYLLASYTGDSSAIALYTDIDVTLGMDEAIPCGLIIQELLSNSMKHAFPHGAGEIQIEFHSTGQELEMCYRDNGIGLPDDLDLKNSPSLGLQLVSDLVWQLHGSFDCSSAGGAVFRLRFKPRIRNGSASVPSSLALVSSSPPES